NIRFYILNSKNLDIYIILSFKKVLHLILQFSILSNLDMGFAKTVLYQQYQKCYNDTGNE
ncbi:hypothetical protein JOD02_000496, partial [Caldicoprobacter guelmensis]|uniref:hypothetical protein n=1 Tax=Caldicoprobacter guelmensis TaxID=1170224 RepID=UPI0019564801